MEERGAQRVSGEPAHDDNLGGGVHACMHYRAAIPEPLHSCRNRFDFEAGGSGERAAMSRKMGGTAGGGKAGANVKFHKPAPPPFLAKLMAQHAPQSVFLWYRCS